MLKTELLRPVRLGRVRRVVGLLVESIGLPDARLGDLCEIRIREGHCVRSEVVGFQDEAVLLMPYDEIAGLRVGAGVERISEGPLVAVGEGLLGRVVDVMGRPLDGLGPIRTEQWAPLHRDPPNPMLRQRVERQLETGIRALDGFLGVGQGQRLGIFAGSGVGKSVLLGMLARSANSDVNVIALIGERGREVTEFIKQNLGAEGLRRSVVIVATGNESALRKSRGAMMATAVAEWFRDRGDRVLLMMDSITRVAMAWREVGLAVGEPATSKGYPSSVFGRLPRLLERTGAGERGTITALYSVLVDGDDFDEPVADAVRGILDGHIVLSRKLSEAEHYPAIDLLRSTSRVRSQIMPEDHLRAATALLRSEAAWRDKEDLIALDEYQTGADPETDRMIRIRPHFLRVLRQTPDETTSLAETRKVLAHLNRMADGPDEN